MHHTKIEFPRVLKKIAAEWFLIGLVLALGAAWMFPAPGSDGGILRPESATKLAVFLIFLSSGLTLPIASILPGLSAWRLHLYVQTFIFIGAPVIFFAVVTLLGGSLDPGLRLGFWFLAILPCTISTAVVMSTSAGGDAAAALFNVTIANLLGVIVVPAISAQLVGDRAGSVDGITMIGHTATMILPPLMLGIFIRPFASDWFGRRKKWFGTLSSALILFICYVSFAQSFTNQTWTRLGGSQIGLTIGLSASLVILLMATTAALLRACRFERPLAVSGFFCSSQKTLAAGVPMALAIFTPIGLDTSLILTPLLCFYALSLAVSGIVVRWLH